MRLVISQSFGSQAAGLRAAPRRWVPAVAAVLCAATAAVLGAPAGSEATTLLVPQEFASIRAAIDASARGDEIVVSPGVYRENLLLTEAKGDSLVIRSSGGSAATTIAYGDSADANESIVTLQRCSAATRLVGFTLDGRAVARRGLLVNSDSRPTVEDLVITGCEYAVAAHKGSVPALRDVITGGARAAGLYVDGASVDALDCGFSQGEKVGVYLSAATEPARLRNVTASANGTVGMQISDSELSIEGGIVAGNGDSGIVLENASPEIADVTVEAHPNVGVVIQSASPVLRRCTIRANRWGAVCALSGEAKILQCTFEDNSSFHVGVEGTANPLLGGSPENANRFLGDAEFVMQTSSSANVIATHDFWGEACVPEARLRVLGSGTLTTSPWMAPDLVTVFEDCEAARIHFDAWQRGQAGAVRAAE